MKHLRYLSAAALLALTAGGAFAQTSAPSTTTTSKPVAPATAPVGAPAPSTMMKTDAAKGATSATARIDLNTASADQLGKLPQIGPAHAKAIVEARAKGKFKDWNDFTSRHVVPSNAETAIKDMVVVQ